MKLKIKVRGHFRIRQFRDDKCIKDFQTHNALTRRGALHLLNASIRMRGIGGEPSPQLDQIPFTEGGELNGNINIRGTELFLINEDSFVALDRDDAIEYRDDNSNLIQGDNRQWTSGPSPRSGLDFNFNSQAQNILVWDDTLVRTDTEAVSTEIYRNKSGGNEEYRGAWLFYERDRGNDFACVAVVSSVEFPETIVMRSNDFLEVTYTLSFNPTLP